MVVSERIGAEKPTRHELEQLEGDSAMFRHIFRPNRRSILTVILTFLMSKHMPLAASVGDGSSDKCLIYSKKHVRVGSFRLSLRC